MYWCASMCAKLMFIFVVVQVFLCLVWWDTRRAVCSHLGPLCVSANCYIVMQLAHSASIHLSMSIRQNVLVICKWSLWISLSLASKTSSVGFWTFSPKLFGQSTSASTQITAQVRLRRISRSLRSNRSLVSFHTFSSKHLALSTSDLLPMTSYMTHKLFFMLKWPFQISSSIRS